MVTASTPTFNHNSAPDTRPPIASKNAMDKIRRLIRNERQDDLLPYLQDQIRMFPRDTHLRHLIADTYSKIASNAHKNGEHEKATAFHKTAFMHTMTGLVIKPDDVRLLCHAGRSLRMLENYREGESFYQRALRFNDSDANTWKSLGLLLQDWSQSAAADMPADKCSELRHDAVACLAKSHALAPDDKKAALIASYASKNITPAPNGYDYRGGGPDKALRAIERFAARQAAAHPSTGAVLAPASP